MHARFLTRQMIAFLLTLGVFLSGVGPSWTMPIAVDNAPSGMTVMADMPMPCADMMHKGDPGKQAPGKTRNNSCAVCTACAVNVGAPQGFVAINLRQNGMACPALQAAHLDAIATPPAFRPPILRA
ncbi:MAG: hypothetical protein H6924_07955 [Alphaproteobacteria bacterium]|nr:hypothetical protein [Alphaproteobacteria bacterium]